MLGRGLPPECIGSFIYSEVIGRTKDSGFFEVSGRDLVQASLANILRELG